MRKDQQNAVLTDGETKAQEKGMKLCHTILTSCSMLKYNRHQNTGTDKLHNISITEYV